MSTISSKKMVDQIIADDGHYPGDPRVIKIVEYTNAWGGTCYGLIYYEAGLNNYAPSQYVKNPKTIWEAK